MGSSSSKGGTSEKTAKKGEIKTGHPNFNAALNANVGDDIVEIPREMSDQLSGKTWTEGEGTSPPAGANAFERAIGGVGDKDPIRAMFDAIDADGSGTVEKNELKNFTIKKFPRISDRQFRQLWNMLYKQDPHMPVPKAGQEPIRFGVFKAYYKQLVKIAERAEKDQKTWEEKRQDEDNMGPVVVGDRHRDDHQKKGSYAMKEAWDASHTEELTNKLAGLDGYASIATRIGEKQEQVGELSFKLARAQSAFDKKRQA